MPLVEISFSRAVENKPKSDIDPARLFADLSEVNVEDVTVLVKDASLVYGNSYHCVVHITIPDLWKPPKREKMLQAAGKTVQKIWQVDKREIISMIHLIHSDHICDRGHIMDW